MKSGIELSHIKPSVRPQDDLYRHMNGAWIDSAVIPADRSSDGAFYKLFQDSEKQVREIIEELGWDEGDVLEWDVRGSGIILTKVNDASGYEVIEE